MELKLVWGLRTAALRPRPERHGAGQVVRDEAIRPLRTVDWRKRAEQQNVEEPQQG